MAMTIAHPTHRVCKVLDALLRPRRRVHSRSGGRLYPALCTLASSLVIAPIAGFGPAAGAEIVPLPSSALILNETRAELPWFAAFSAAFGSTLNAGSERLPAGSEVRFREFSIWEQYRWQVAAAIFVFLQTALIGWLLFEHRRRRILEMKLRARLLELIHLNRIATAGVLSASVAHELNQPLGTIQSYAEAATLYLQADPPDIERAEKILANIRRDNQRAADIISHLRGLLKKRDELELEECDLNKTVRDALQILRPEALKRGVALDAHEAKCPLPVRADPIHLQQVILNLAVNGMDAMRDFAPGGGEISIHTALADESAIEVRVADSGMGIPTDKLDTIFDSFHTTKRDGTGLGLSIARAIVETHGGKIWAENRPTGGAVFCFRLPYSGCSPYDNVDADHSRRR